MLEIIPLLLLLLMVKSAVGLNAGTKWRNRNCFAVISKSGKVVGYGGNTNSTICTGVPDAVNEIGAKYLYSTSAAYVAMKSDSTLAAWGFEDYGGKLPTILEGEVALDVSSTHAAFGVILQNRSVYSWGYLYGQDQNAEVKNVDKLFTNNYAFCALHANGSLTTFGPDSSGGKLPDICGNFSDYTGVYSSDSGFAAIRSNGDVCAWGSGLVDNAEYKQLLTPENLSGNDAGWAVLGQGSDGANVTYWNTTSSSLTMIGTEFKAVYTTYGGYAAVSNNNNTLVAWGAQNQDFGNYGADFPAGVDPSEIELVYATYSAFSAIKTNGEVIAWGDASAGGDMGKVVVTDARMIAGNYRAFCALTSAGGNVLCWGDKEYGTDVPAGLSNVTALYANDVGFSAVVENGTVYGWGSAAYNLNYVNADAYIVYGNTYYRAVSVFPDFYDLDNGILPNHTPTNAPTSPPSNGTFAPTMKPTASPTSPQPSNNGTFAPTTKPTASPTSPTFSPTFAPSFAKTEYPTLAPTFLETNFPTIAPTYRETDYPTVAPTPVPTARPTQSPTCAPTSEPTQTGKPTFSPTVSPTNKKTSDISVDVTLYISGVSYSQWIADKGNYDGVLGETIVKVIDHEDQITVDDVSEISVTKYTPSTRVRTRLLEGSASEQVVAKFQIISPGNIGLTNDDIIAKLEAAQEKGYFTEELRATSKEDGKTTGLDEATVESVDAKPKSGTPPSKSSVGKESLDTGSIVGIVIGVLVFLILSGITAYYFLFIRKDASDKGVTQVDNLNEVVRSSAVEVRSPVHDVTSAAETSQKVARERLSTRQSASGGAHVYDGYGSGPSVAPPAPGGAASGVSSIRDSIPDAQGSSAPTSPAPLPPISPKQDGEEDL